MCLILIAWQVNRDYPLIVAANRDEFHARPAARAAFWEDMPEVLAGRDLQARGTWMGVSRGGRFAAVTNYRGGTEPGAPESRGALVTRFLEGVGVPELAERKSAYSGFNLLAADGNALWWLSNRDGAPRRLERGWYGLGNLLLDSPEVEEHKIRLRESPAALEPLLQVLEPARIVDPRYGTRCSSVLLQGAETRFAERAFARDGAEDTTLRYEFSTRRIS
ncbi:MAG: NRDE family protein [Betaproteobacteria bacterium]|nr:NRDE family protein [Betaproteobacteria bacterium]